MLGTSIVFSFVAGLLSFFAPCVVALMPVYLAYITGLKLRDMKGNSIKILTASLYYTLGFTIIFVLLGTTASGVGYLLRDHALLLGRVGGLFIILLGLDFLGVINIAIAKKDFRFSMPHGLKKYKNLNAFFLGVTFALAWTPCVGAPLGSILTLAAVEATAVKGALLLFVYSLGISIPFVLSAVILSHAPGIMPSFKKYSKHTNTIAGTIMLIIGILLLTNTFKYLNTWLIGVL